MTESGGCGFIMSKAGIFKLLVLISGCACWTLYVASGLYRSPSIKTYVLAAYIISWAITLILYFLKVTNLHIQLQSECMSFNTFDYFWAWVSFMNYLSSSAILAGFFSSNGDPLCNGSGRFCPSAKQLTALILGSVTAIIYSLEAQNLRYYAPAGAGYVTTWRGIWKVIILMVGGAAFCLLITTGYRCGRGGQQGDCTIARTFVLIAWCVAWSVAALMYLLRFLTCPTKLSADRQLGFGTFEFFWSAFACLLYLVGAAVYAGFLRCNSNQLNTSTWGERLASDICGFVTAILFGIDAYFLRDLKPFWFVSRRVESSGGRRVTTTTVTTERRTTRK